jgi:hypothetical protein
MKCPHCNAPVTNVPDGDLRYDPPRRRARPDLPEGVGELVERFRAMARAHYETRHDRSRLLEDQSKLRSDFYAKTADTLEALAADNTAKDAEIARLREGLGLIETDISSAETYNPNIAKIVRIALQEHGE